MIYCQFSVHPQKIKLEYIKKGLFRPQFLFFNNFAMCVYFLFFLFFEISFLIN